MSDEMKAGVTGGFIVGCVFMLAVASFKIAQVRDEKLEQGRQIGLCESKGGRMVDGVCGKFEVMK